MKKISIMLLILLFVGKCIACSEGQININTATVEELDNLSGIGPVKAQEIINTRLFNSVDELINVKGIGEKTLEKIKEQGLACVDENSKESEDENSEVKEEKESIPTTALVVEEKETMETEQLDVINLTKNIKTENNNENENKGRYAVYGLVAFCFLLGLLFVIKKRKSRKDELE